MGLSGGRISRTRRAPVRPARGERLRRRVPVPGAAGSRVRLREPVGHPHHGPVAGRALRRSGSPGPHGASARPGPRGGDAADPDRVPGAGHDPADPHERRDRVDRAPHRTHRGPGVKGRRGGSRGPGRDRARHRRERVVANGHDPAAFGGRTQETPALAGAGRGTRAGSTVGGPSRRYDPGAGRGRHPARRPSANAACRLGS